VDHGVWTVLPEIGKPGTAGAGRKQWNEAEPEEKEKESHEKKDHGVLVR